MSLTDQPPPSASEERGYHTYKTHHVPWFVRVMWIAFWIGLIWYVIAFAMPAMRGYF